MKFLIYPAIDVEAVERIRAVSDEVDVVNAKSEEEAMAAISNVEAMYGTITPRLLEKARKLRWLQTPIAGLENYMFPDLIQSNVIMTNMAGIYSDQIADHAMAYILTFARSFHIYLRQQLARNWKKGAPVIHLADQTLGVIGLGGIGREVAKRGKAADMRVVAIDAVGKEKPDFVDELWGSERLADLLEQADFVVSCVPHTPETVKLIGANQLKRMKKSAYLINISRGIVVDLAALTKALQSDEIAGAGLDVFEIEPLPADHPLWGMENVLITPHVAAASPHVAQRRIDVVAENLRRYLADKPLQNLVNKEMWF